MPIVITYHRTCSPSVSYTHLTLPTIGPAQVVTADMAPDKVGTWMFHCHVDDHMKAGMQALYRVLDNETAGGVTGTPVSAVANNQQVDSQ